MSPVNATKPQGNKEGQERLSLDKGWLRIEGVSLPEVGLAGS